MDDSIQKIKSINEAKAARALEEQRYTASQLVALQTQETIVKSFKTLVDFLDNKVTKTEVINQLQSIGTPDVAHVVEAVNHLHETLKTHENTDLSEITGVMRELLEETKQIPKELPEIPEAKVVDYSKQLSSLESAVKAVEKVVKGQKLIAEAPVVNVPETNVNVEAPDLKPLSKEIKEAFNAAIKSITFPEYKTDNKEVEKLLKKSNKLLEGILDKPVGRGGGSGRATPYQDSAGTPAFVTLDSQGRVPITQGGTTGYSIGNSEDTGTYKYYGFEDKDGRWYFMRKTIADNSYLYAAGTSGYSTAWTDRASQTYASYSTTFN